MAPEPGQVPSPLRIFEAMNAFQRTGALLAGIQLDVFTAIAEGAATAPQIAAQCGASERGIRILCDTLSVDGLLTRTGDAYANTSDGAVFLNSHSPAYLGKAAQFLNSPELMNGFLNTITDAVRKGGTMMPGAGTVEPNHPAWVAFAKGMGPLMIPAAQAIAAHVPPGGPIRVLDIAAGHGMFGITIAQRNPEARITAVDWEAVLAVAQENAAKFHVADRLETISGSAFDADLGSDYDLVLITNFLHHFDPDTNTAFLRRVHGALKPGGRAITLEFVPDETRTSPPNAVRFALTMLGSTAKGDAYTFRELEAMSRAAGFARTEIQTLEFGQALIISTK